MSGGRLPRETSPVHGKIFLAPGMDAELGTRLLQLPAIRIISEGRRGRLEQVEEAGVPYARKVYRVTKKSIHGTAVRCLPAFMRWGRARRSWRAMIQGEAKGLPLPRALSRIENRQQARLVTTWIPGEPLHLWHARQLQRDPSEEWQRQFADWLGQQLHKIFASGLATRDLSPNNVLIAGELKGPWQFHVVDLDEARIQQYAEGETFIDQVIYSLSQVGHLPPTISPSLRMRALFSFLRNGGQRWAEDQGDFSLTSTTHKNSKRARKKFIRQIVEGVQRFDRRKEQHLLKAGRTGRYAGWGLDDEGCPLPYEGARELS